MSKAIKTIVNMLLAERAELLLAQRAYQKAQHTIDEQRIRIEEQQDRIEEANAELSTFASIASGEEINNLRARVAELSDDKHFIVLQRIGDNTIRHAIDSVGRSCGTTTITLQKQV